MTELFYQVDPVVGFTAEVSYKGAAQYPPVKPGQVRPEQVSPYIPAGYLG